MVIPVAVQSQKAVYYESHVYPEPKTSTESIVVCNTVSNICRFHKALPTQASAKPSIF